MVQPAASATITETATVPPARAWSSVGILMLLLLVSLLDRQIISLLVDPIKADLGLSDTQISLLQGFAFILFYSAAAIPLGWAVDRYPRRIICYLGVTVWSIGAAACGLASQFWHLFVARITVGAGEATLSPCAVSLISDIFPREKVGTAMGAYGSAVSLGSGVALIAGGIIIDMLGRLERIVLPFTGEIEVWQAVFLSAGLPGLLIAFLALLLTDPRPARTAVATEPVTDGFGRFFRENLKLIAPILGGFSFAAFTFYAVGSWTPAFFGRAFGLGADQIGIWWGLVVALSGAGGALLGGVLMDRFYRAGVEDAVLAVPAFAALAGWPFLTFAYQLPSPVMVLIALGVGTMMVGIVSAGSLAVWQAVTPPRYRGRMTAIFGLVSTGLGASFGPVMPALLTDRVFRDEMMVGTSLSIVMAFALPLLGGLLLLARRYFVAAPAQAAAAG